MGIEDYDAVLALWKDSDAIVLSKVDSLECIKKFLERNTGLSYVAMDGSEMVGAVLCSHDGRLGYLSHLVVVKGYRRQGIGRQLVGRCMYALTGMGIHKCILLIMKETKEALDFWRSVDPAGRVSLVMMGPRSA
jgi:ribosomal protein S18 acetylase RimI-like enzyme